ncbi:DUF3899 domain-containing protein [Metabacillus arenae]|uniref:DUF3899 domain-containing protein n=1 Tax=Metabacillus arenae TaxID=2771434 RepID=A0A926NL46_9BACI|nr:DUF3899 domain-containing protein [Metabacillus arenae]MBD1383050.1 DUF3899 domain-containing protein [Metabacillus arenae]
MYIRKAFIIFIFSLLATVTVSFIIYKRISLVDFINISFIISGLLILFSLLLVVVNGGFFDGVSYGFRRLFQSGGKTITKKEVEEMIPLSEMIDIEYAPILFAGILLGIIMLAGLFIYYV